MREIQGEGERIRCGLKICKLELTAKVLCACEKKSVFPSARKDSPEVTRLPDSSRLSRTKELNDERAHTRLTSIITTYPVRPLVSEC